MNNWNPSDADLEIERRVRDGIASSEFWIREEERKRAREAVFTESYRAGIVRRSMLQGREYTMKILRAVAERDGRMDVLEWLSAHEDDLPTFGYMEGTDPEGLWIVGSKR